MSRVLRAVPLMLNERSNILTSTEKLITSKADPPDRGPHRTQARRPRVPCDICPQYGIIIEDSCGFQWRDVDAVTLEFPLEYFCYHRVEFWQIKNILEKITAVVSLTLGYG